MTKSKITTLVDAETRKKLHEIPWGIRSDVVACVLKLILEAKEKHGSAVLIWLLEDRLELAPKLKIDNGKKSVRPL